MGLSAVSLLVGKYIHRWSVIEQGEASSLGSIAKKVRACRDPEKRCAAEHLRGAILRLDAGHLQKTCSCSRSQLGNMLGRTVSPLRFPSQDNP